MSALLVPRAQVQKFLVHKPGKWNVVLQIPYPILEVYLICDHTVVTLATENVDTERFKTAIGGGAALWLEF